MERLQHFSHEHPLVFIDEARKEEDGEEVVCYGCKKSILGSSAYNCGECNYFLHKKCAELPLKIEYPMHNEHPLTLYANSPYSGGISKCNVCLASWKGFIYHCAICQFDVDILCILEGGTIEHKGHHHPLTLLFKEATFTCSACDTEGKEQSYLCTKCQFWIHKSCALSPSTFTHSDHDHPLVLAYSLPYENRSFYYYCENCRKRVHPSCWVYCCDKCRYFVHMKCATSETARDAKGDFIADDPTIIQFPLTAERSIALLSELLNEVSLVGNETAPEIDHSSHDHPLALFDDQSNSITNDIVVVCDCCIGPITSAPFYGCIQCGYFLHISCTELPLELQHPCHPEHLLEFCAPLSFVHNFQCNSCQRYSNGFFYKCKTCKYRLDISCAFFPKIIKHEGHKHPLHIAEDNTPFICEPCGFNCKESRFACDACDYPICISCVGLPRTVKHDWDRQPLILSYPPYSDHPDRFYCEICEEEMYPKSWAYRSRNFIHFYHTDCIIPYDKDLKTKFGGTLNVENHPHPLTFVRKSRNKSPSLCDRCGKDYKGKPVMECTPCNFVICRTCCEYIS